MKVVDFLNKSDLVNTILIRLPVYVLDGKLTIYSYTTSKVNGKSMLVAKMVGKEPAKYTHTLIDDEAGIQIEIMAETEIIEKIKKVHKFTRTFSTERAEHEV